VFFLPAPLSSRSFFSLFRLSAPPPVLLLYTAPRQQQQPRATHAVLRPVVRSGCRGDDSGHLGFLARDARLFDLCEYEVVVGVVVGHDRGWRRAVLAVSGWRPCDCDGRGGLDEVVEPGTLGQAVFGGWGRWSCPVVVGLLRVVLGAGGLGCRVIQKMQKNAPSNASVSDRQSQGYSIDLGAMRRVVKNEAGMTVGGAHVFSCLLEHDIV
jgi:hypothetical protein